MAFPFFMGEVKAPILRHGARVKIVVGWAAVVKARIGGNYKARESYICRARHRGWEGGIIPNPRQECARPGRHHHARGRGQQGFRSFLSSLQGRRTSLPVICTRGLFCA